MVARSEPPNTSAVTAIAMRSSRVTSRWSHHRCGLTAQPGVGLVGQLDRRAFHRMPAYLIAMPPSAP